MNVCQNCGEAIHEGTLRVWYHSATGNVRCDGAADGGSGSHSLTAAPKPDEPDPGPQGVCWEHQAGELPIRLSFTVKVF